MKILYYHNLKILLLIKYNNIITYNKIKIFIIFDFIILNKVMVPILINFKAIITIKFK